MREDDVLRQLSLGRVLTIANPAEFQFQVFVFFVTPRFADNVGRPVLLPLRRQKLMDHLQPQSQRDMVEVGRIVNTPS